MQRCITMAVSVKTFLKQENILPTYGSSAPYSHCLHLFHSCFLLFFLFFLDMRNKCSYHSATGHNVSSCAYRRKSDKILLLWHLHDPQKWMFLKLCLNVWRGMVLPTVSFHTCRCALEADVRSIKEVCQNSAKVFGLWEMSATFQTRVAHVVCSPFSSSVN